MKILADESVDRPIVEQLRQNGYQVWYVADMEPGISDDIVLDLANREGGILLTADKDFGELVFRQGRGNYILPDRYNPDPPKRIRSLALALMWQAPVKSSKWWPNKRLNLTGNRPAS